MSIGKKRATVAVCIAAAVLGIVGAVWYHLAARITFTFSDTLPDGGGKQATVILLGGQSNASGCSLDAYLQRNVSAQQYAAYQNGYDNIYINFISGAHTSSGFVKCTTLQGELDGAFGPELGMAERLHQLYPDRTFFIIKCAWGGTDLFSQWLSPSSEGATGELYKQFEAFVQASLDHLREKNYRVEVAGMCWMQGESDSFSVEASTGYGEHLSNLIADLRDTFGQQMAFVDAYIAENPAYWVYYEAVNRGKREVAAQSPYNTVVDTMAAQLSCSAEPADTPDLAHYDSLSQIKLGHLFAEHLAAYIEE